MKRVALLLALAAALAALVAAGPAAAAQAHCSQVRSPKPRKDGGQKPPTGRLSAKLVYRVTFVTNCGDFTVTLDQKTSPRLAASFAKLVRNGFFDRTVFHRIVPGFVIQGGDPTQTGMGGPGYSTVDRPPANVRYVFGVVAMAKTQAEPAGTSGSQFFVVTGNDVGLPPDYALLGTVTKGAAVVRRIGTLGDPSTEQPTMPVVIQRATLSVARR